MKHLAFRPFLSSSSLPSGFRKSWHKAQRGQTPFGIFTKIHPFWWRHPSLNNVWKFLIFLFWCFASFCWNEENPRCLFVQFSCKSSKLSGLLFERPLMWQEKRNDWQRGGNQWRYLPSSHQVAVAGGSLVPQVSSTQLPRTQVLLTSSRLRCSVF